MKAPQSVAGVLLKNAACLMSPRFLISQNAQTFLLGKQWWDRQHMINHIFCILYVESHIINIRTLVFSSSD